jgi:dTDP-4-dehydrorhamnose reductase
MADRVRPRRILLLGVSGQVGWELRRTLSPLGELIAPPRQQLDLSMPSQIREAVEQSRPDVIVNAAAYTAVDRAEEEVALAEAINAQAPGILAEEAKRRGALLIHYSTDYVFDGSKGLPYTEQDPPRPLNVYGRTKRSGEAAIEAAGGEYLILRTSWVYGRRGKNFLLTVARLAAERDELRVVDDQLGAPTWSRFIAEASAQLLGRPDLREHSGIYHLSAGGQTSWCGFARAILGSGRIERRPRLAPITTDQYPTAARRPGYSVLDTTRLQQSFGLHCPPWDEQLSLALEG